RAPEEGGALEGRSVDLQSSQVPQHHGESQEEEGRGGGRRRRGSGGGRGSGGRRGRSGGRRQGRGGSREGRGPGCGGQGRGRSRQEGRKEEVELGITGKPPPGKGGGFLFPRARSLHIDRRLLPDLLEL